jgi:PIN domain nuclease of toxin-antitoxin system
MEDNPHLGQVARQRILAADTRLISVVSAWEISIKMAVGRLRLSIDPAQSIAELMYCGFQPLSIKFRHAWTVADMPMHHADPFDRMLIAQAKCEGLTLATADQKLAAYGIPIVDASQ